MKKLYANCSEVIWRLDIKTAGINPKEILINSLEGDDEEIEQFYETRQIDTSCSVDGLLEEMIELLKKFKKTYETANIDKLEIKFIDDGGGGGDYEYVEKVFELAKKCLNKEISMKEANKLIEEMDDEEEI